MRYIPTPPRHRSSSNDQYSSPDEDADEEYLYMLAELYKRPTRYQLDVSEYERPRHQLMEYIGYRRKFE